MTNVLVDAEKTKEDWLRQELRATRALLVSLMQWGISVLALLDVIRYYVRQDVTAHLREIGRLNAGDLLPLSRWSIGTLLLLIVAYLFDRYSQRVALHHNHYRSQLVSMTPTYTGIAESIPPARGPQQYLFFAIPVFDLAVWAYYYLGGFMGATLDLPW